MLAVRSFFPITHRTGLKVSSMMTIETGSVLVGAVQIERHAGWLACYAPTDEGAAGSAVRRRRVLLVEDEYFIASEIEHWLAEAGFEVVATAISADEAISASRAHRPDMVIMDIRLSGGRDGIDSALDIYSQTGIRCLFASAHVDPSTRGRATRANPLGWLSKPYRREELLNAISHAFAQLDDGQGPG